MITPARVTLCEVGTRDGFQIEPQFIPTEQKIEVVDLLTLKPMDHDAVIASVKKTGRLVVVHEAPRTGGMAGEIFARVCEDAFYDLRAPMTRVTGYDVPYPYWQIEDAYMPSVERVVDAARRVLAA